MTLEDAIRKVAEDKAEAKAQEITKNMANFLRQQFEVQGWYNESQLLDKIRILLETRLTIENVDRMTKALVATVGHTCS